VDSSLAPPTNRPVGIPPGPPVPQPPRYAYTMDGWIKVVSSRLVCLIAVLGAIAISGDLVYYAESTKQVHAWILAIYCVGVVIPTVLLYLKRE